MHLLPQRPASRHIIIDQQRMKERLGMIVRAKERYVITHFIQPLLFTGIHITIDYDIAKWST